MGLNKIVQRQIGCRVGFACTFCHDNAHKAGYGFFSKFTNSVGVPEGEYGGRAYRGYIGNVLYWDYIGLYGV